MHQWSRLKPHTLLTALTALAEKSERRRMAKAAVMAEPATQPAPAPSGNQELPTR